MDVFDELGKAGLPKDKILVLGSGILGALGIREINDIDLLIMPDLFEELKAKGWEYAVIEIEGRPREKIAKGPIEAFKDFWWKGGTLEPESAIADGQIINGVRFLPLRTLLKVKQDMGREKDIRDVALIEEYFATHSPEP